MPRRSTISWMPFTKRGRSISTGRYIRDRTLNEQCPGPSMLTHADPVTLSWQGTQLVPRLVCQGGRASGDLRGFLKVVAREQAHAVSPIEASQAEVRSRGVLAGR